MFESGKGYLATLIFFIEIGYALFSGNHSQETRLTDAYNYASTDVMM